VREERQPQAADRQHYSSALLIHHDVIGEAISQLLFEAGEAEAADVTARRSSR
jgi:hypothetical protein